MEFEIVVPFSAGVGLAARVGAEVLGRTGDVEGGWFHEPRSGIATGPQKPLTIVEQVGAHASGPFGKQMSALSLRTIRKRCFRSAKGDRKNPDDTKTLSQNRSVSSAATR
jgi:hypothetical protein